MKHAVFLYTLAATIASPLPLMADDFRFPVYQNEPTCGDGPALPSKHQFALAEIGETTYIAHYREDGVVKELTFSIKTPDAFQGDKFPEDICGSKIVLSMDGGPDTLGVMEYVPPIPNEEHQPWPYAVKLEGEPMREMRFSGSYFTSVWGAVEVVSEDGSLDRLFFTGASAYRWD